MTLSEIQKRKAEIIALEKQKLKEEREKKRRMQAIENRRLEKLKTRVKIYIGAKYLNSWLKSDKLKENVEDEIKHAKRDQDLNLLQEYLEKIVPAEIRKEEKRKELLKKKLDQMNGQKNEN